MAVGHTRKRGRLKTNYQRAVAWLTTVFTATVAMTAFSLVPVTATGAVIYNNIPNPLPGNLPSQAYEATQTSEFGGQVMFTGVGRANPVVTVVMSSWGCGTGNWYTADCVTSPGTNFLEPITLNVYSVGANDAPGTLIKSDTQIFAIPDRPSADNVNCPGQPQNLDQNSSGGKWFKNGTCFNGLDVPITFSLGSSVNLPDKAIVSVAYNTSDYGALPYGDATACHASSAGCGYDSLNVAVAAPPSVGTDPLPNDAYLNSTTGGQYCRDNTTTTGTFRLDKGCWTGYQPAIKVEVNGLSANDCKNNGWKNLTDSNGKTFKNQGDCVSYYATGGKNTADGPAPVLGVATGNLTLSGPTQLLSFDLRDRGVSALD